MTGAVAFAQDSNGGWRRVTDPPPSSAPANDPGMRADSAPPAPMAQPNMPTDSYGQSRDAYGQTRQAGPPPSYQPGYQQRPMAPVTLPEQLTLQPGTFVTVRIDQTLSSDHNAPGDMFSATLLKPLVVDGFVVAQRGQTIAGHVTEVQKAGRVSGTSRLGIELSDLTAVDGQQVKIHSQLVNLNAPTSKGRDAQAIGTTTGVGAAIGAIADGGSGAAIGAGAGAAASIIGVLLTRGHASVIYPESVMTFRIDSPVVISTARAPQAFQMVDTREYEREAQQPRLQTRVVSPNHGYYATPYPYYGGYYGPTYYGGYYPYYWGPSVGFLWGGGGYYGRGYYGRGYYGGGGYRGRR